MVDPWQRNVNAVVWTMTGLALLLVFVLCVLTDCGVL
jgi:hypothetical protein